MRVITLWQPWASWVILGWKTIESRLHPRFASLAGERIGIHAGLTWDKKALDLASPYLIEAQIILTRGMPPLARGKLIGTVRAVEHRILSADDSRAALIDCENTTRYGLILKNPVTIIPIPMKGRRGIWHYQPTGDLE